MPVFWMDSGTELGSREEPRAPNENVGSTADEAGSAAELLVRVSVFGEEKPSDDERCALDESKEPLASFNDRPHDRIQFDDLALLVKNRGCDEVNEPNSEQEIQRSRWECCVH